MVRSKLSAGKLVKVVTWIDGLIQRGRIEPRNRNDKPRRLATVAHQLRLLCNSRVPGARRYQRNRYTQSSPASRSCLTLANFHPFNIAIFLYVDQVYPAFVSPAQRPAIISSPDRAAYVGTARASVKHYLLRAID